MSIRVIRAILFWTLFTPLASAQPMSIQGRSLTDLAADLAAGRTTSEALVTAYQSRIAAYDRAGPNLHAILARNLHALDDARASDAQRKAGSPAGPLEGIPILLKDNIETRDPDLPTTAGSLALAGNITNRDATLAARLRAAGAIILGKTNLSEWANMRGSRSVSGWSATGGQTRNPYAPDRSPCGSSSGSAVAVAASFAAAAIGTETDGSVTCPASVNGIVGFKPTLGLIPRTRIVPLAHSQDTAGPMARTVRDAAILLNAMAGPDDADPATAESAHHLQNFAAALKDDALNGSRIGVMRFQAGFHPETDAVFAKALDTLRAAGATLVEIDALPGEPSNMATIGDAEQTVLLTELKADLAIYLTGAKSGASTLSDLIAFNRAHSGQELAVFGQELFEKADLTKGLVDPAYRQALALSRRLAGQEGIDRMLHDHQLAALVAPTAGPAWLIDPILGDHALGEASTLPAVAGYPHLSLPMGQVSGLPVGLSIIGPAWSDALILSLGHAFEKQRAHTMQPSLP